MGVVLQVHIPHRNDKSNHSPQTESASITFSSPNSLCNSSLNQMHNSSSQLYPLNIPSIYEMNIFKSFTPVISHIQLLWELVLTCEPITVMAPTPDVCSQMVQSLVNLIFPLKYGSDFRPFFTIHDSEFKQYTTKTQSPYVFIYK